MGTSGMPRIVTRKKKEDKHALLGDDTGCGKGEVRSRYGPFCFKECSKGNRLGFMCLGECPTDWIPCGGLL